MLVPNYYILVLWIKGWWQEELQSMIQPARRSNR